MCLPRSLSFPSAWAEVRNDSNPSVDWIIVGYDDDGNSKTDITLLDKGTGGITACSEALPEGRAVFGGCRKENGRFVTFFYASAETPPMQRGRASMHKNGKHSSTKDSHDATFLFLTL
jgi:hypothetical protein